MSEKVNDDSSKNLFEQIRELAREFRKLISRDKAPRIEKYLARIAPEGREDLFAQLLDIEISYRRGKGESLYSQEYIKRFPQLEPQVRRAFFEPTLNSVDSSFHSETDHDAASVDNSKQDKPGYASTYELSDANRIGDYELIKELGRGGMGIVYEARQTNTQNRVALKTLPTSGDGQQINADKLYRFRREFRRLSEINHPNLVGMQSLEVEGDRWFITMDVVDGMDFLSFVRPDHQLDESRLRKCLRQLAAGVMELHRLGIIHRDLKPSNVLVSKSGHLTILDFGLAAQLQKAGDMTQTKSGLFAGTPPYAAPEQLFGERTEASDWYAFGTMMFEALAGDRPFQDSDPMVLLRKKQEQDPPQLSDREDLPTDLAELADGLLKREPNLRMSSQAVVVELGLEEETCVTGSTRDSHGSTGSIDAEDGDPNEQGEEEIVLVGRDEQLNQLENIKVEFLKNRQPQIVWITGLSGEGKSSLADKFLQPIRRREDMLVLSGRCYDRESVPFKVIDSLIPSLTSYLRTLSKSELERLLPHEVTYLAQIFPLLNRVAEISARGNDGSLRVEGERLKLRGFQAFRDLLKQISARKPIVILMDDLQWGDSDSATVLRDLLLGSDRPTVIWIGSYRRDEALDSPFLNEWSQGQAFKDSTAKESKVEVSSLTQDQCLDLVVLKTGSDRHLVEQRAETLLKESGGNPYLFEQLIEGFDIATGTLERIPLDDVVQSKLRRLPHVATELLQMVAISGQPLELVEAARAIGNENALSSTATRMRSERLLRLIGSGANMRVETYHDKIRESLLASLTEDRRRKLHLALAETIEANESVSSGQWLNRLQKNDDSQGEEIQVSPRVVDLAHHFHGANDSRAFIHQLLAAEQALKTFAFDEALAFFKLAKSGTQEGYSNRLSFRVSMGTARASLYDRNVVDAIANFNCAIEVATTELDRTKAFAGLGDAYRQSAQFDAAIQHYDKALLSLGHKRPRGVVGRVISFALRSFRVLVVPARWQHSRNQRRIHVALAEQSFLPRLFEISFEKNFLAAVDAFTRGILAAIQSGRQTLVGIAYAQAAYLWSAMGFIRIGNMFLKRSARIDAATEDMDLRTGYLTYQFLALYWSGQLIKARSAIEESMPILRRALTPYELLICVHIVRHMNSYISDSSTELASAKEVLKLAEQAGNAVVVCWGNYDVASALARRGDFGQAMRFAKQSLQALPDERFHMTEVIRGSVLAFVYTQCSHHAVAKRLGFEAWKKAWNNMALIDVTILSVPMMLEGALGAKWLERDSDTDIMFVRRAIRIGKRVYLLVPNQQPHLLRMFGRAEWRLNRPQKAVSILERAIRLSAAKAMDYQRAKCLLDLAAVKEEGREVNRAEAIELLKRMESVIPRAESWLLGDQYDEEVVAPEFDLDAWEAEHGDITSSRVDNT